MSSLPAPNNRHIPQPIKELARLIAKAVVDDYRKETLNTQSKEK